MAILFITEYAGTSPYTGNAQIAQEPALTSQTRTISGTSAQASALNARTRVVRLHADTDCYVLFGTNPTAITAAGTKMIAGQTEYFGVAPSTKIAVIT